MSAGIKASVTAREPRTPKSSWQETKPESSSAANLPADQISFLQRTVGNREVGRLLSSWVSKAEKTGNGQAVAKSTFQLSVAEGLNHRGERVRNSGGQSAMIASRLPNGAVQLRAGHSAVLQRKCACGGAADASGECAECRKKRRLGLQTKLKINDPGDIYEQEADRIANHVTAALADSVVSGAVRGIQRFSGPSNRQLNAAPASVEQTLASGGRPMEPALRHDMQQRFGHDFSSVRIHTGAQAHDSARTLCALAYTVGNDVVFGAGQYAPDTRAGRSLLAHELTHVVQQGGGRGKRHAPTMVQRQPEPGPEKENEQEKDFGVVGPPQPAPAQLPGFGDMTSDAACPALPTNLGRVAPEPPCPTAHTDIDGERFTFCRASDVFSPGSERPRLITWARSQPARSTFVVHGYASESDGTPAQNVNVSCHRAKRVARELYNAGVRSELIGIAARGGTTRFGSGAGKLALNRVAVVRAEAPNAVATPTQLSTDRRAIIDLGVGKLTRGEYRLAADAYVSKWTCGRIPSLAEAVRRSVVRVEGEKLTTEFHPEDAMGLRRPEARLGFPIRVGRNEIVLAKETFDDTTDPVSCVMARVVDLVFHHTVSDLIPDFNQQHSAALFLIELAGLPPCRSPDAQAITGSVGRPAFDWWRRPTTDPRKGLQPDCGAFAEGPLPGAITPQPAPATLRAAPTFTVRRISFEGSGGAATVFVHPNADVDPAKNIAASGRPPGSGTSIRAVASVAASGSPAEVARYQVGFVQTIVSDRVVVDYVGGQRVRFGLPVPIRDGRRREGAAPPWFDPGLVDAVTEPGRLAIAGLSAEPWIFFPYHFMDPALRGRIKKDPKDPTKMVPGDDIDHGNIVNRAHRATVFNIWLIARRDDAPPDRFSTHVLDGRMVAWAQRADFIGAAGTGSFDASVDPTPLTDTADMQLAGPTAAELEPPWVDGTPSPREMMSSRRVVEVAEAAPKAKGVGLSLGDYVKRVQEIAKGLEAFRRALDITDAIRVRIHIDLGTGRPKIHRPPKAPAADAKFDTGETELIYEEAMRRYAEEILFRARKDLVLADTAKIVNSGHVPVIVPEVQGSKRPTDVMAPHRGTDVGVERQRDLESEKHRAATPGVFDATYRVPVNVKLAKEEYSFDFTRSDNAVRQICGEKHSVACVKPELGDREKFNVAVTTAQEQLGASFIKSPIAIEVTLFPATFRLFVPISRVAFEGMSGRETTEDSLIHELHHMLLEHALLQTFKQRLARAIRGRVMALRELAASDRSLRSGALAQKTIEAVVWDELNLYFSDYLKEGDRINAPIDAGNPLPMLTEAEIQRRWPAFRMPARKPNTKGSLTP